MSDQNEPNELEYLRSDASALRDKLAKIQGAAHQALMLHLNGEPAAAVKALQEGMRQLLGEHPTSYWLRDSEHPDTVHFETWAARERMIAKLRARGVKGIEIAELPARCCCPTEWRAVPVPAAKRARAKRAR